PTRRRTQRRAPAQGTATGTQKASAAAAPRPARAARSPSYADARNALAFTPRLRAENALVTIPGHDEVRMGDAQKSFTCAAVAALAAGAALAAVSPRGGGTPVHLALGQAGDDTDEPVERGQEPRRPGERPGRRPVRRGDLAAPEGARRQHVQRSRRPTDA